jgi:hypothetical protein
MESMREFKVPKRWERIQCERGIYVDGPLQDYIIIRDG